MELSKDICTDLDQASTREWLVTNGLGGYAMGTVAGICTRRYHGLLVASIDPPVKRRMLLSRLDESITTTSGIVELATHRWRSGAVNPQGYRRLQSFRLDLTVPVWTYDLGGATLERRVWMVAGRNATCIRYSYRGESSVQLSLNALVTDRDHHALQRYRDFEAAATPIEHGVRIQLSGPELHLCCPQAQWSPERHWHLDALLTEEQDRGYDHIEDYRLVCSACVTLRANEPVTVIASIEPHPRLDGEQLLNDELQRARRLIATARAVKPPSVQGANRAAPDEGETFDRLVLAADQFVVRRGNGSSVIAGYPWFTDWGRDTMISFPGLFLCTGRISEGEQVLRTFAASVEDGLIPNRFGDTTAAPEFNTVDATLWFALMLSRFQRAVGSKEFAAAMAPVLSQILTAHLNGTRYGIGVDPRDGLLRCGVAGEQLTWMDAKVGDWVVTPRRGKPVETNALWYAALTAAAEWPAALSIEVTAIRAAAERVRASFAAYVKPGSGSLHDVIDCPDIERGVDSSVRVNQLLACAVLPSPLNERIRKAVIDECRRELLVPGGVRTLSPHDLRYVGRYAGDQRSRDRAYHQGTAWPWLTGAYLDALSLADPHAAERASVRSALFALLPTSGVGSIGEVLDGDLPHRPGGCPFQAWSVAEALRHF